MLSMILQIGGLGTLIQGIAAASVDYTKYPEYAEYAEYKDSKYDFWCYWSEN